jgi:hypothetical protein
LSQAQDIDLAVQDMAGMFSQGEVGFKFRNRYEMVEDENFDRNAKASTLLSRMTFTAAVYRGFSFLGEFDNVSYVYNVNRISGPDDSIAQPAYWKGNLHLARRDSKLL